MGCATSRDVAAPSSSSSTPTTTAAPRCTASPSFMLHRARGDATLPPSPTTDPVDEPSPSSSPTAPRSHDHHHLGGFSSMPLLAAPSPPVATDHHHDGDEGAQLAHNRYTSTAVDQPTAATAVIADTRCWTPSDYYTSDGSDDDGKCETAVGAAEDPADRQGEGNLSDGDEHNVPLGGSASISSRLINPLASPTQVASTDAQSSVDQVISTTLHSVHVADDEVKKSASVSAVALVAGVVNEHDQQRPPSMSLSLTGVSPTLLNRSGNNTSFSAALTRVALESGSAPFASSSPLIIPSSTRVPRSRSMNTPRTPIRRASPAPLLVPGMSPFESMPMPTFPEAAPCPILEE